MNGNWFDAVLLLVVLTSVLSGLRAGFARVVVGLISTVFGLLAGFWFYRMVAASLLPYVKTDTAANLLGFFVIFLGILVLGSIVATILAKLFSWIGLSWFDHLLGGLVGIVRGAFAVAALVAVIVAFTPSPPPDFLNNSRVLPYATQVSGWLAELAPRELKDAFSQQVENLRKMLPPAQPSPAPHQKEV